MRRADRGFWALSRALASVSFLAVLLAESPAEAAVAVQLDQAKVQVVTGGTWDAPPAQAPALDPAGWQPVQLPHVIPRALLPSRDDPIDTAWYSIEVPRSVTAAADPDALMLYLPRWQTVGQVAVYAGTRLAWRSRGDPVWNGFNHPLWVPLDGASGEAPPTHVLLRIDYRRSAGAAVSTAWLGDADGLKGRRLVRETVQSTVVFVASTTFLVIGLFALLVWMARREPAYGLFFLASGFFFLRALHFHLGLEPLPVPSEWFGWWTVHSQVALAITINVFALRLAALRMPRIEWLLVALAVAAALLGLPVLSVLPEAAGLSPLLFLGTLAAFVVFSLLTIRATWRARSRDGLAIALWNSLSIPGGVHDWMLQNHRISPESVYLLPLTAIGLFSVFLAVVVRRYVAALRRSEEAQQVLESELRVREAELTATYERLRLAEHERILSDERQRLMQDMHDGLGSSLMGALKAVEHGRANDLAEVLRQCLDDLKLAIDSLEPVQADLLVLLATLRYRLGTRLEQAGLHLAWNVEPVPALAWLDARAALQILRILQEVLTNAVKHSQATTLTVSTQAGADAVLVVIEDDGVGFDAGAAAGGRGLGNIRRRADAIGARVSWRSQSGKTVFELTLPLQVQDPSSQPGLAAAG